MKNKNYITEEECISLLKKLGFGWKKVEELEKENERLKKENHLLRKKQYGCLECFHYQRRMTTWVYEPPAPSCALGHSGCPHKGEFCKDFLKKNYKIIDNDENKISGYFWKR